MPDSETARFPIVRRPEPERALPVLVTIPHFGVHAIPGVTIRDFARPSWATFARGYADAFAADLYGNLHASGATVLASPFSRLFVDLNRRRDDFEVDGGAVRSARGVARTHTVRGDSIFAAPLEPATLEERLADYYDPFHARLSELLDEIVARHGSVLLVDAHTGSERGMGAHQVVVGTRRGSTCAAAFAARACEVIADHGYAVARDVRGYAGGHIVRRYAAPEDGLVHAIQIEVNSALLMTGTRREFIDRVSAGEAPAPDRARLDALGRCMATLVRELAGGLESAGCGAAAPGWSLEPKPS